MTDINELLASAETALKAAVEAAYKSGFDDGKKAGEREASAGLKSRLAALFADEDSAAEGSSTKIQDSLTGSGDGETTDAADRAAPGTVKPVVLDVVARANNGVSTKDIERATKFKYNSIRGTLWTLQKEGAIERNLDGKWVAVQSVREEAKRTELEEYIAAQEAAAQTGSSSDDGNKSSGSDDEAAA